MLSSMVADVTLIPSLQIAGGTALSELMINTATILILFPLLIIYLFTQRLTGRRDRTQRDHRLTAAEVEQ